MAAPSPNEEVAKVQHGELSKALKNRITDLVLKISRKAVNSCIKNSTLSMNVGNVIAQKEFSSDKSIEVSKTDSQNQVILPITIVFKQDSKISIDEVKRCSKVVLNELALMIAKKAAFPAFKNIKDEISEESKVCNV